jgi:hypothetical protein
MSNTEKVSLDQISVDTGNLYREETITDLKTGSIQVLTPVTTEGQPDLSRPVLYTGQTQIVSQAGLLPVSAPIEAASLSEALEKFPDAIRVGVDRMIEEAREMQREAANRIVVPGKDPGGGLALP